MRLLEKIIYYFPNFSFYFHNFFPPFSAVLSILPPTRSKLKCKNISKWCFVAVHRLLVIEGRQLGNWLQNGSLVVFGVVGGEAERKD